MDRITLLGVRFPAEMMLLLKSLYTLNGVLREISPKVRIDLTVAGYALKLLLLETPGRQLRLPIDTSSDFPSHLSNYDLTLLALSLPLLCGRLSMRTPEDAANQTFDVLEKLVHGRPITRQFFERLNWPRVTIAPAIPSHDKPGKRARND